ncbi:MAG: hypothetical protein ACW975_09890 [Candidatus Thorarchaeota archaeon]|jgi:hypothetical protein
MTCVTRPAGDLILINESSFETPVQKIELKHLPRKGWIIDIGGGGEGLVSRIETSRVCAVDINLDRIREAKVQCGYNVVLSRICSRLGLKDSSDV